MKNKKYIFNPIPKIIKENENILKTFTKIKQTNIEAYIEQQSFHYVQSLNLKSPKILSRNQNIITIEYIEGLSAFKALEHFSRTRQQSKTRQLIEDLCESLLFFQQNSSALKHKINTQPYNVANKLYEVADIMDIDGKFDSRPLRSRITKIKNIYDNKANMLFRDATPKNYILKDVTLKNIDHIANFQKHIYWIDFSSIDQLTFANDDFASILYHYMLTDKDREYFIKKYKVGIKSEEDIVSIFVRLSRFWVRRIYYREFFPKVFKKRYQYEDIDFYEKNFIASYKQIQKIL